jgi:hypothetical protein
VTCSAGTREAPGERGSITTKPASAHLQKNTNSAFLSPGKSTQHFSHPGSHSRTEALNCRSGESALVPMCITILRLAKLFPPNPTLESCHGSSRDGAGAVIARIYTNELKCAV